LNITSATSLLVFSQHLKTGDEMMMMQKANWRFSVAVSISCSDSSEWYAKTSDGQCTSTVLRHLKTTTSSKLKCHTLRGFQMLTTGW